MLPIAALLANPMFQGAAMNFLPALLGKLGLFGKDPQAELRKKIGRVSDPANQQKLTQQMYQQFLQSPAYAQAQGSIAGGANAAQNQLASSLGARGLGSSGIGSVSKGIAASLPGMQMGQLQAGGYQGAQTGAQNQIRSQIEALLGGGAGPSQGQQLMGAGMQGLSSMLMPLLMKRMGIDPSVMFNLGNQNPQQGTPAPQQGWG
jgi:hypothetical protein